MLNNEENRQRVAETIVDAMELDDLKAMVIESLCEAYKQDDDVFAEACHEAAEEGSWDELDDSPG